MREINTTDRLDKVYLTKRNTSRADRAAIVIGDSIYLWKTYEICDSNKTYKTLGSVPPPYTISKKVGSNTLIVTKSDIRLEFCPGLD